LPPAFDIIATIMGRMGTMAMVLNIADSNGHAHDSDGGGLTMIIIPAIVAVT
jgi:hypothetical protein